MNRLERRVADLETGTGDLNVGDALDLIDAGADPSQPSTWPARYAGRKIGAGLVAALNRMADV